MKALLCGAALALVALPHQPARAQVYDFIKWCKGNWRTIVVCVVVEKGVEKVVEKSIDEWWGQWKRGEGKAAPPAARAAPSRDEVDFRTLMKGYELKTTLAQDYSLLGASSDCGLLSPMTCAASLRCRWAENRCQLNLGVILGAPSAPMPGQPTFQPPATEMVFKAPDCSVFLKPTCELLSGSCRWNALTNQCVSNATSNFGRIGESIIGSCAGSPTEASCNVLPLCQWSLGRCNLSFFSQVK
jgi:hypothetical protein